MAMKRALVRIINFARGSWIAWIWLVGLGLLVSHYDGTIELHDSGVWQGSAVGFMGFGCIYSFVHKLVII
jgi:hypothetical protein